MKASHFEELKPICPICWRKAQENSPLELRAVERSKDDSIEEGFLRCAACRQVYPILDGIPLLVADLERVVQGQIGPIASRRDLSSTMENWLGHYCGRSSAFETTRYHLSIYARDHYGDFDTADREDPKPGSALRVMARGLDALDSFAGAPPDGPVIDIGCSVGRTSFELARRLKRKVVGVDLSFPMLRLAQEALRFGRVRYPRRLEGSDYQRREVDVELESGEEVDFWLCDATELPFRGESFALASHIHVLDCVPSPYAALENLQRVLETAGQALLVTPFDWSPTATPLEAWLGGHSQRGPEGGFSEPVLRSLLGGGHPAALPRLRLVEELAPQLWQLRLDDRQTASYQVYSAWIEKNDA